jgi:hypothetical protein
MLKSLRNRRANHSTVVAYLALFVGLGGTGAYAANQWTGADIVDESLTGADVKGKQGTSTTPSVNGSLTTHDVAGQPAKAANGSPFINGTLTSWDIADGTLRSSDVQDNSLGASDLGPSSVNTSEVADNSLTAQDIDESTLPGLDSTVFRTGSVVNQPNGQDRAVITASGLDPGNYLVTFRMYMVPAQRYFCGIAAGSIGSSVWVPTYRTTNSGGNPETFESTGVMSVSQSGQDQILYCNGFTQDWDASNAEVHYMKIGAINQGG